MSEAKKCRVCESKSGRLRVIKSTNDGLTSLEFGASRTSEGLVDADPATAKGLHLGSQKADTGLIGLDDLVCEASAPVSDDEVCRRVWAPFFPVPSWAHDGHILAALRDRRKEVFTS